MPSLHVGIAFLLFLVANSYSNSKSFRIATAAYTAVILVGSVHLGWHYSTDGVVAILGVALIWWASGKFVDWVEARELAQQANACSIPLRATP
jgi:membrane-associated phospholipid phosphatase